MGKTIPSYRIELDEEIRRWNSFAQALRGEDREAFERLMDTCRNYASAGSNATRPVMFEPMTMSILVSLQKRLNKLEKGLNANNQHSNQP